MPVIHHVSIDVSDLERSAGFYDAVLAPLGWRRHTDFGLGIGWGMERPWFFISTREPARAGSERVCFAGAGLAAVKAAWKGGIEAGGTDEGSPTQRTEYGPSYYSAYLLDPDGYRIEIAVG